MLNISEQIHATAEQWQSSFLYRIGSQASQPITERCSDILGEVNDATSIEQDNFRRLSAYRLLTGSLSTHLIADLKKRILTFPSLVRETGARVKQVFGGLSMNGTIRCANCGKQMDSAHCPSCASHKCYLDIYWKKKHHIVRRHRETNLIFNFDLAQRQLTLIRADIDRKVYNPEEWKHAQYKSMFLEYKIYDWLAQKEKERDVKTLKPETLRAYKSYTNSHYIKFFKGIDVREIKYSHLEDFYGWLGKRVKIKTRKNIMWALHGFLRWLKRRGVIDVMPEFPVIEGGDSRVLVSLDYEDQATGLENVPEIHRDHMEFGFDTGLRPNESCALQVGDINLHKQEALIQRGYSGSILVEAPKETLKLPIPLSDRAVEILEKHIKGKFPSDFVFTNPVTGRGYLPETLSKYWKINSGIDVSYYEASRHSFCTQIAEDCGANELQAQLLMRHVDPRSTRRYFHGNVKKLRDIVNMRGKVVALKKIETSSKRVALKKPSRKSRG